MAWLDRDRIWRYAWGCIPVAVVLNLAFGAPFERGARLLHQGQVEAQAGRWERAAQRYEQAARADESSALYAFNAAAAALQAGDRERARHWNEESLRRDPTFTRALEAKQLLELDPPPAALPR